MTEHVIGLSLEEQKAFMEQSWSHTVGVVNLIETVDQKERSRCEGIGTGCACLWKGAKIVLTAKHVLDGAGPTDLAFLPRAGTALEWDTPGKMSGLVERVAVGIDRIVRCEWEDLAAIILKPEGAEALKTNVFCPLPKRLAVDSTVRGAGSVLVVGFPVDHTFGVSKSKYPGGMIVSMACPSVSFWGELVETPARPLDHRYDPDRHLLIRFEPETQGSRPFGYSGGAVWCDPARRGAIWAADPLLLGVEFGTYEKSGLVIAIRASVVRKFLEESL